MLFNAGIPLHPRYKTKFKRPLSHGLLGSIFITLLLARAGWAATVTWNGGGDGVSWSQGANWSGNLVPTAGDDVVISGAGGQVTLDGGNVMVRSLQCDRGLSITNGSLALTSGASLVKGTFKMRAGTLLSAAGPATTVTCSSAVNIDGASLSASSGGVLFVLGLTSYSRTNSADATWQADGPGSRIVVTNLAAVAGFTDGGWWRCHTSGGGRVEVPAVQTLTNGWFEVTADGTNSVVDLSELTTYQQGPTPYQYVSLEARNSGSVLVPQFTTLNHVSLTLRGPASVIPLAQIRNADNSALEASDGAVLALPGVSQAVRTNGTDVTWQAEGAGTRIVLANLTNIVGFTDGGWWRCHAYTGGRLELPAVQTLTNGWFEVTADGTNSVVDLSRLTSYQQGPTPYQYMSLEARNSGSVLVPQFTTLNHVSLTLRGPASVIPLAQIRNADNSALEASDGAVLALPGVTQVVRTNGTDVIWQAEGAGTRIVLANLTNIVGFTDGGWWRCHAYSGGRLELPAVQTLTNGWFDVAADGTNSVVDLSGLTSYQQGLRPDQYLSLAASNGGTVWVPQLSTLNHVGVTLRGPTSVISLAQIRNADNSALEASDGAVLALPGVTQVVRTNGIDVIWQADGAGTRIVLANLTTIVGFTDGGWWRLHAYSGGRLELPAVQTLTNGWFEVTADGPNSAVDLSGLTSYQQGPRPDQYLSLEARKSGTVLVSQLTTLNHVSLTLRGPASVIPLAQIRTADNSALEASDGAVLALPGVTQVVRTNGIDATWQAEGAGTRIVLANLTNIVGFTDGGWWRCHAYNGGRLELPAVQALTNGWFEVTADRTNSVVDLSELTSYQQGTRPDHYLSLEASNGGTLLVPQLTTLNHVSLTLRGPASVIPLAQIRNADNSALEASDGAVLALPGVSQVVRTNGIDVIWQAEGTGTRIVLANLTTIAGFTDGGWWRFHAYSGGRLELPAVQMLTNGWFEVTADGPNSVVDLSGLTNFQFGRTDQYWSVEARNGGSTLITRMTDLDRVALTIRGAGFIPTLQIRSITLGTVTIDGAQVRFPNLAITTGTQFYFQNGGSVKRENPHTLPLLINQVANSSISTAFGSDVWEFSAQAGESIRLHLVNASRPGVFFTLLGPDDWIGFSSITNDSPLVTLPSSGNYLLQAAANGSAVDYAFEVVETAQTDLALGSVYTGQFVGSGQAQLFRVQLTNASPLLVLLRNDASGNLNELYIKRGIAPTRGDFDYRFSGDPGSNQQLIVPTAASGTWYVLVYGDTITTPGNYTLAASASGVLLSDVAPRSQAVNVPLVLSLDGAGFDGSVSVQLLGTNGQSYTASQLEADTFTHLTGTFLANTLPVGTYSVQLSKNGSATVLETNALSILSGGEATIETKLILPAFLGFHIPMTVYIEYTNSGTISMPAPLLLLRATQDGRESTWLTLDPTRLISGYWTPASPEGYSHSVQFLAMGATPGLLQPGESGRVPVYYAGIQRPWERIPVEWSVTPITTDNSLTLNRDSIKDQMRPPTISAEAWNVIWPGFAQRLGTNWGQYVQTLDDNATYLGRLGKRVQDAGKLIAFELLQANRLNPLGNLANAIDGELQAPGLSLNFTRSFPGSIAGRFKKGALGRGWSHNWDYTISTEQDGKVTILGPGESRRVFEPDSRNYGVYFPQPGDHGTLTQQGDHFELVEPDGLRRIFRPDGPLGAIADPNSNRIDAGYSGGLLVNLTHSSGQSLAFGYNSAGLITSIAGGQQSSPLWTNFFTYDAAGEHLSSVSYYDGRTTSYAYELNPTSLALHALNTITSSCCNHRFFTYDVWGRLESTSLDGGAETLTLTYGPAGKITVTDALGNPQFTWYDHRGLVVKIENALGNATQFTYDDANELVQTIDPAGLPTNYTYDDRGNLQRTVDPVGNTTLFSFAGPFNRLTGLQDANSHSTRYRYDANGNLEAIIHADSSAESWLYDNQGNAVNWTNRRSQVLSYQYNSRGAVTNKLHSDGSRDVYFYDYQGDLTNVSSIDPFGATLYSLNYRYDAVNRLTTILYPGGKSLSFTYDQLGSRHASLDEAGHRLSYSYDAAGLLESLTNELNQEVVRYFYDPAGRLQQKRTGNTVFTSYGWDAAGQLLSLTNRDAGSSVLSFFNCTYDSRGRRDSMQTDYGKWSYEYDALGQLVHAVLVSTDPKIPNQDLAYSYDALGNRVSTLENGLRTDYQSNDLNQYLQAGVTHLAYDADGNLANAITAGTNIDFLFDDENRLIGIRKGGDAWDYLYDALGNQVRMRNNGVTTDFVLDRIGLGNVVGEYSSTGDSVKYNYGFELLDRADISSGQSAIYAFDETGNTAELVGAGGVLNRYAYGPFGDLSSFETIANPFRSGGAWGVSEDGSGLLNMRARFYDPHLGRFISEDPLGLTGGDANLYRYVGNAVPGAIDPLGKTSPTPSLSRPHPPGPTLNVPPPDEPPPLPDPPPSGLPPGHTDPRTPGDPNSKTGPAGYGLAGFISAGALPYRVDFENQTNADAPAQQVFITDQLSTNLDWSTLRFSEVGFGDMFIPTPNFSHFETNIMMSYLGSNFVVQVQAGVNMQSGQLYAVFRTINPDTSLPPPVNIGFLPPEDGNGRGQGHLSYIVNARAGLTTGAEIRNVAVISFDNLSSLATNLKDVHNPGSGTDPAKECLNTIDAVAPTSLVLPLAKVIQQAQFPVAWTGQDDPGGAGIATYDILVSDNGQTWQPWLTSTAATTAMFEGIPGHTYAFLSRARDHAGNFEPAHVIPDTIATVAIQPLEINAALSSTNLNVNNAFSYTLIVTNQGSADATAVVLSNNLPAGFTVNAVTVSSGSYSLTSGALVWSVGNLPRGSRQQITVNVTGTQSGTLTNLFTLVDASGTNSFAFNDVIRLTDPNPRLGISLTNGKTLLTWPEAADGFHLMVSGDLTNWLPVGGSTAITGNQQSLVLQPTEANQFYQLRKP